jgi:DNA-binding beta-propeller fold protein YncE
VLAKRIVTVFLFMLWICIGADAQTVTGTVTVGSDPEAVVTNSTTNKIYVLNTLSNNVSGINGA